MDQLLLENQGVRARRVESCILCGAVGTVLYRDLRDRLFAAPGIWNLRRCPACRLIWLDPRPLAEDISQLYRIYFADVGEAERGGPVRRGGRVIRSIRAVHFGEKKLLPGEIWRPIGALAGTLPMLRDYAAAALMFLQNQKPGKLLDVGCGSGEFLLHMRDNGWDVQGLEPYEKAANAARDRGIPVAGSMIEQAELPSASLDAITACHVVEHVDDPRVFFRKSIEALRPGGRLVVLTPCAEALGHFVFGSSWVHLDVPRHLQIFSLQALRGAARESGFEVICARTISRGAIFAYLYSKQLREGAEGWTTLVPGGGFPRGDVMRARGFWMREEVRRTVARAAGEELLLVARRPRESSAGERR